MNKDTYRYKREIQGTLGAVNKVEKFFHRFPGVTQMLPLDICLYLYIVYVMHIMYVVKVK